MDITYYKQYEPIFGVWYISRLIGEGSFGKVFELEREEMTARCLCHEIEHLDGHLYVEHIDHFLSDEELEAYYEEQEGQ